MWWESRSSGDARADGDQIVALFPTTTLASYGLITSAGRLVLAHVADLPALPASTTLSVAGGVKAKELLGTTENTDPVPGEYVVTAIAMTAPPRKGDAPDSDGESGDTLPPLAIGTRHGVIKRWNRESPTTMDSWSVIDLKDGDTVVFAAPRRRRGPAGVRLLGFLAADL